MRIEIESVMMDREGGALVVAKTRLGRTEVHFDATTVEQFAEAMAHTIARAKTSGLDRAVRELAKWIGRVG